MTSSICWKLASPHLRCRTDYTYWDAFQIKLQKGAERDNEKDTSDVSLLGVSQMMYFWEYAGPGATAGVPASSAKTEKERESVREQTKGISKVL